MNRVREIVELTRARFLLMLREPEVLFWVFVFPIMLTVITGLAFRGGGATTSRIAVVDGPGASELCAELERDGVEVETFDDADRAAAALRSGAVDALVDRERRRVELDPARDAAVAARLRAEGALQRLAGRTDPIAIDTVEVRERGSRYVDWLVPGLLGLNLMSTTIWAVGFALVEARQRRLLKRFLVTPMARSSFLASYVLARMIVLVAEVAVLLAVACWIFGVPMRGSLASVALLSVVGALAFSGLAILIGSRARSPEAASGLIYLTMMPMGLSSGVFFSYERFAPALRPVIEALPLTALNDALRATMLEGASLASFGAELAILAAWGVASFLIGLFLFRWQ